VAERQVRPEVVAYFLVQYHLGLTVAVEPDEPPGQRPGDRAGDVDGRLEVPVLEPSRPGPLQEHLRLEHVARALGDDVDPAARRRLAVERARRTLEHFDLLQRERIDAGA